jgi:hypothetical protein
MILIYCDDMYNEYCIITVGFFNPCVAELWCDLANGRGTFGSVGVKNSPSSHIIFCPRNQNNVQSCF